MQVIIPAKATSARCPNKNFSRFYRGKSLFQLKFEQIQGVFENEDMIIVSDAPEAEVFAKKNKIRIVDDSCVHGQQWGTTMDYWYSLVDDEEVAVVMVTAPLFNQFEEALQCWEENKTSYDSLVVTTEFQHFVMDAEGRPVNFHYGYWQVPSSQLPKWYIMQCSFWITQTEIAKKCAYYIGQKPYVFTVKGPHVDIDTEEEFQLAKLIYHAQISNSGKRESE